MAIHIKKRLAAVRHGFYSAMSVLPGEDAAEFEQLHQQLIAEWKPNGAFEVEQVSILARLVWRRRNLHTFRVAEFARRRLRQIQDSAIPTIAMSQSMEPDRVAFAERLSAADHQARQELGDLYDLVELGDAATIEGLAKELDLLDRLDGLIDKCIKRLLYARGFKSMAIGTPSVAREIPPSPIGSAQ